VYPWRASSDPYAILVSEFMLQQTQAARVVPAFERFLSAFPSVASLAAAGRGDIVRAWAGLGYNRRAVALSEAARAIVRDHDGRVPADPEVLRTLPGVGPYTAAAVAALAFGAPVAAVDTNVRRIVARFHVGLDGGEVPPARVGALAEAWLDRRDPGTWNQALMDLGREVCRPEPRCHACPLAAGCRFRARGRTAPARARRQGRFDGSSRQLRGAIVRLLRERSGAATMATIASRTGVRPDRVREAVVGLHRDGLVIAWPAALRGRPGGRVALHAGDEPAG
jgi:A/G-specific adenine glycosylase